MALPPVHDYVNRICMKSLTISWLQCVVVTAALFSSPFEIAGAKSATAPGQSSDPTVEKI